jgi:hypothetical protein
MCKTINELNHDAAVKTLNRLLLRLQALNSFMSDLSFFDYTTSGKVIVDCQSDVKKHINSIKFELYAMEPPANV